jgi:hypothetical protein
VFVKQFTQSWMCVRRVDIAGHTKGDEMKTVLEQALEALENMAAWLEIDDAPHSKTLQAIAALKEAIKNQGEPVGEVVSLDSAGLYDELPIGTLLYTPAATIPGGWQLVPKELPLEIVRDLWRDGHHDPSFTWTATLNKLSEAMLSAAPKEPGA